MRFLRLPMAGDQPAELRADLLGRPDGALALVEDGPARGDHAGSRPDLELGPHRQRPFSGLVRRPAGDHEAVIPNDEIGMPGQRADHLQQLL